MPDNNGGRGSLSEFAHNLVARVVMYYVGLGALIWGTGSLLPDTARTEILVTCSPLIAFRDGAPAGLRADAGGPFTNLTTRTPEPLALILIAVSSAFL